MGRSPCLTPEQQAEARQRQTWGITLEELARSYMSGWRRFRGIEGERMNVWEWESFEGVISPFLFKVTNAGPLHGPIQNFSITRDSKRRLNLETLVMGDVQGGAVDHPAGTVRRTTETVEFAGASGQTCVAYGVLPRHDSGTWDNNGVKHTRQKSSIQLVKARLKPDKQPAYVIEWFENFNRQAMCGLGRL